MHAPRSRQPRLLPGAAKEQDGVRSIDPADVAQRAVCRLVTGVGCGGQQDHVSRAVRQDTYCLVSQ